MRVTVYCASSAQVDPAFFEAAEQLGNALVDAGAETIYGGGNIGLMGRLADTILARDGKITGIIPQFMKDVEYDHPAVEEMICVPSMHERKRLFLDKAHAVVALPGGCGTLEELLEVITLKKLGLFLQPVVIINTRGFFDPLLQMLDRCIEERFMRARHRAIWSVITDPTTVMDAINNAPPWDKDAIRFAAIE